MAILPFRTSTYARNIYIFGTAKLTDIPVEYVQPAEQYAAENYTTGQIENALSQGWITQQEHDDTVALIPV